MTVRNLIYEATTCEFIVFEVVYFPLLSGLFREIKDRFECIGMYRDLFRKIFYSYRQHYVQKEPLAGD